MGYVEGLLERAKKLEEKCKTPGFKPTLQDVYEKITILQELEVLDDLIKAEEKKKEAQNEDMAHNRLASV